MINKEALHKLISSDKRIQKILDSYEMMSTRDYNDWLRTSIWSSTHSTYKDSKRCYKLTEFEETKLQRNDVKNPSGLVIVFKMKDVYKSRLICNAFNNLWNQLIHYCYDSGDYYADVDYRKFYDNSTTKQHISMIDPYLEGFSNTFIRDNKGRNHMANIYYSIVISVEPKLEKHINEHLSKLL